MSSYAFILPFKPVDKPDSAANDDDSKDGDDGLFSDTRDEIDDALDELERQLRNLP
jgi:hypothetical protein